MIGSCNVLLDNDQRCNKTYFLHNLIFRDPNYPGSLNIVDLCKWHYDQITTDYTERIRGFQLKLSNLIAESARLRRIARENDVYYDNTRHQQKIEDLRALIKNIQRGECANFFCNKRLNLLGPNEKIFTVTSFKPSGKRHYTFNYCCLKCFNIMKAKCGLPVPILTGQLLLEVESDQNKK